MAAIKLACGLASGVLLAVSHAQTLDAAREQAAIKAFAHRGDETALQELLRSLALRQGMFAEAKRIADLARKTKPANGASEDTERLFRITDLCHAAGSPDVPKSDRPSPEEVNKYKAADLECIDYREGLGVAQDYAVYRKCLLSKPYTLMENYPIAEIYASGWGVARNPKLATALVCREEVLEADLDHMLKTLEPSGDLSGRCAYGTSMRTMLKCAAETQYIERRRNDIKLEEIKTAWSIQDRASFARLMKALNVFSEARAQNEFNTHGQVGVMDSMYVDDREKGSLLGGIRLFENKQYPPIDDAAPADQELNRLYREIMQSLNRKAIGSITLEGVRQTQRLWLIYRDYFVKFALTRYPGTKQEQWLGWLTNRRVEQLRELRQEL